jgi:hypothetical protein
LSENFFVTKFLKYSEEISKNKISNFSLFHSSRPTQRPTFSRQAGENLAPKKNSMEADEGGGFRVKIPTFLTKNTIFSNKLSFFSKNINF